MQQESAGRQVVGPNRRRKAWVVAAIISGYSLLLCALWWRVFLRHQICAWDCILEYWPDLRFQIDSVRYHELPTWCPWSLGGYPFVADLQSGFYSPVNWVCIVCGLIFSAGPWLIQLKVMLSMLIGLCGMHCLVWRRTSSHTAAVVSALTYVMGSPLLVHKNGAFLWPLLYLPWAVLAISWFVDSPSIRRGALLAMSLWLCGSAGHPQAFFYDLLVVTIYWIYLTVVRAPRETLRELRRQWRGLITVAAGTALLLIVIYLPSLQAIGLSHRATRGASYVLDGNLSRQGLRELFVPNLDTNWQLDVYVGPLAIVGGLWAIVGSPNRQVRFERLFWVFIAALGLDLALGSSGHTLPFFFEHVPGFTLFRIAYRLKVIFGFAAALLAGEGVAMAVRARPRKSLVLMAAAAVVWLVAATVIHASTGLIAPAGVLAFALASGQTARLRTIGAVVIPVLVLVDLWRAGSEKLSILQDRPDPDANAEIVEALPGVHDEWRYHVNDVVLPTGGTLPYASAYTHELRELSGYGNPITSQRLLAVEASAPRAPGILAHFNVRYELGGRLHPPNAILIPNVRGYESSDVSALVRVYPSAVRLDADRVLESLRVLTPSALTTALVEDDAPIVPVSTFVPVDGKVLYYSRKRIEVEVRSPQAGVLVLNEPWYPGWRADVNGNRSPVFRANYLLRGVLVPPGASRVVFEFEPEGYRGMFLAFIVGLIGLCILASGKWAWLDSAEPDNNGLNRAGDPDFGSDAEGAVPTG